MSDKLALNRLFTDHMVLQRDRSVPVWGTGADGVEVTVRCQDVSARTVVRNGEWKVSLPALHAGGPFELVAEGGEDRIVLRDVLVGDVWLAGGQSNMEWRIAVSANPEREVAEADWPTLRFYDVPRVAYDDGQAHAGAWTVCTPETASEISAVGYHFARTLIGALDVPIGIIGCNWGGTSASCWVPEESIAGDPDLRVYLDEYRGTIAAQGPGDVERLEAEYQAQVDEFVRKEQAGYKGEELGYFPWPPPMSERSFLRPNGLYGTMLEPTVPYGIKGFIYYQGESDANRAGTYDKLLGIMIAKWRADWGDESLPFLFVQLPGYGDGTDREHDTFNWPNLREAQQRVTEQVRDAFMAVILDCGEELDIHPKNKRPVGERLAGIALGEVYGRDVSCYGPMFRELDIDGGKAIVRFAHAESGLVAPGGELLGFEIAGSDGRFVPAEAKIVGGAVEASSTAVPAPSAVRYAWASWPEVTLFGGNGLPAAPFRSDR
ncbi:sialate O-acetylesterase [Cohnella sp. GCM10027633]|uniref:sialate O-acetylesterase n=1 Tax=unclassified Cohnella TaxID=2636738 RepID=UPI00362BDB8F